MTRCPRLHLAVALLSFAFLLVDRAPTFAQDREPARVDVAELFPHSVGDRWLYGAGDGGGGPTASWIVTEPRNLLGETLGAPSGFTLESEEGEIRILRLDAEQGLLLIGSAELDPTNRSLTPPLALLPATLEPELEHSAESEIVESVDRREVRRGVRRIEARVGSPTSLVTPAGEWTAWPVATVTTTTWDDEEPVVERSETWYAPGLGPVRRRHESNARTVTEELLEAKVGDRLIPP